jgi:glutamate/tyrosine decarboxylase-like PLP-dependent enzyme
MGDSSEKRLSRTSVPGSAFIDPEGSNYGEIQKLAGQVLDLVLSAAAGARGRSPLPETPDLSGMDDIPSSGDPWPAILGDLKAIISSSMNATHPGYMGHMDSTPTTMSILAGLVTSALNNNMLSVEMSPVFSRLERLLMKQIARLFGLGERATGVLLSGGTLANLQALTLARNMSFPCFENGLAGMRGRPVVFASEAAHVSIQKAAMITGIGKSAVISVAANSDSQMDPRRLSEEIMRAEQSGATPFCVVATAGTTTTGSVDPLLEVSKIAKERGLWFHVDAAYAGALVFSGRQRHKLAGIETADSVTFNPQKWMYVAKTCAILLVSDESVLQDGFRVGAPYMGESPDLINLGEISVQGTRHADVLKLWLSLRHLGSLGYAQLIDRAFGLAHYFTRKVKQRPFLQMMGTPQLNIVCFRAVPERATADRIDDCNARLQAFLLREGNTFLSLPLYRGNRWLRAVLLNPYTDETTIDEVFDHIDAFISTYIDLDPVDH